MVAKIGKSRNFDGNNPRFANNTMYSTFDTIERCT